MDPNSQQQPYQPPASTTPAPAKGGGSGFGFNIKRYVGTVIHYWYWFVLSLLLALIIAYIYLLIAKPVYLIKGSLLVDKEEQVVQSDILSKLDMGGKKETTIDLYNEINLLRSEDLVQQAVDSLNLNVTYFTKYKLHEKELYHDCPIRVVFDSAGFIGDNASFSLRYTTDGRFNLTEGQRTRSVMYDTWITRPYGRFKIEYAYNLVPSEENYLLNDIQVVVNNRVVTTQRIINELEVTSADGRTSVLNLTYKDNIPERGIDIMNILLRAYFRSKYSGIDVNAQKARDFINKNKVDLMADLRGIDSAVEAVKMKNNVIDVDPGGAATTIVTERKTAQKQLDDLYIKKKALINLRNLLLNMDRYEIVVPIGIDDDILEALVNEYNNLVRRLGTEERVQELGNANPFLQRTLIELEALKRRILEVLARISEDINNDIEVTTRVENKQSDVARNIADADRQITELKRGYPILQNMYLKLFEKGIENEISFYNQTGKSKIMVSPYANSTPISPIARNIYLMALLLGLLIPAVVLLLKELLNQKILHEDDITSMTDIPVVGAITRESWEDHNTGDTNIAVRPSVRSGIAEQFRILRANLDFIEYTDDKRIINVTSSESGEGKTFVALNLGIIMALSTKRVIVVEFDLRRPRMADILNISNTSGLSEYLEGTVELQYIIKPSGIHSNLYVINCGQVPPNPGDLLTYPSTQTLLNKLQDMFDVVIIDTAPINIVSDAVVLSKYAGINMYVVRQGMTMKQDVKEFHQLVNDDKKVHTPVIVFNSVDYLLKYGYFSNPNKKYEQIILDRSEKKKGLKHLVKKRKNTADR